MTSRQREHIHEAPVSPPLSQVAWGGPMLVGALLAGSSALAAPANPDGPAQPPRTAEQLYA